MFSKILMAVFISYIIYYSSCIFYDFYIKKLRSVTNNNEELSVFVAEQEEKGEPKNVLDDEILVLQENTNNKVNVKTNAVVGTPPVENRHSIVEMNVEGQSIPFELLMNSGKSIFAAVSF